MDPRQRLSSKDYYEQFWRIIAFLEASFTFVPCVADAAQETILEAKLQTICASMSADKTQHQAAIVENSRLLADNDRLRTERNRLGSARDWYWGENLRLQKEHENLQAELNSLKGAKARSPDDGSQSDKPEETPAQVVQEATVGSLQAQLDAVSKDRSTLLERLQKASNNKDQLGALLQKSNNRIDHLTETLVINAGDTTRSPEELEHIKEELHLAHVTINKKDDEIAHITEELRQNKSQLSKAQAEAGEKCIEADHLEQRLKLMDRSDRQKESQITRLNKRLQEKDRRAERDKWDINDLEVKIMEQQDRLKRMGDSLDECERHVRRLSESEKRIVHEAVQATDQLRIAQKETQDRQQEIDMMKISLAQTDLAAENYRQRAESHESKVTELEADLKRSKSMHTWEEMQWQEFTSRGEVLATAVESMVQWKREMSSKMSPGSMSGYGRAQ
ncbi:hypothetical protein BGZ59_010022 [Podila verticillata]|nr:hypothetical protein BGZ59_010022 [Podila verticillata]KFH65985.1 hypothetical protein MVEG_08087 [Podila verticillata NRRL 6337]